MSHLQVFLFGPFADAGLLEQLTLSIVTRASGILRDHCLISGTLNGSAIPREQSGSDISGVLLTLNGQDDFATLEYYLQVHGFRFVLAPVDIGRDTLSVPTPVSDAAEKTDWNAHKWQDTWAPIWRSSVSEILGFRGNLSAPDAAARLPVVWSRAAAAVSAQKSPRIPDSGLAIEDVTVDARTRLHSKFFALDELTLSHKQFDGAQGPQLKREIFVAVDAVTVLPYDPQRDVVLLVEQIRMGVLGRGDPSPWLMEPIAGRIEPGDTPQTTAHKEASEEAGVTLGNLHHVASYYPSAGCVTEYVHSYVGIADLPDNAVRIGGVDAEGEDIRGHILSRTRLMQRVAEGSLPHGPLILTAFWLQSNLDQLRGFG